VDNTASGRHPLDVSWSNLTAVPGEVVVPKRPMKHVRYSFKATVRVIGKASRWPNAEFIKQKKRIKILKIRTPNGPSNTRTHAFSLLSRENDFCNASNHLWWW
jgi:hypothetical protein